MATKDTAGSVIDGSSHKSLDEGAFINLLRDEVRKGHGLVPFIGSGCSADSGILMGKQFTDYLGYTVWKCLQQDVWWDLRRSGWPPLPNQREIRQARDWARQEFIGIAHDCGVDYHWDKLTGRIDAFQPTPQDKDWSLHLPLVPPFLRSTSLKEPEPSASRQLLPLLPGHSKDRGGLLRPNRSPSSPETICEKAIRALHDWRATLAFLSELKVEDHGKRSLALSDPDGAVVDSFNVHITRGRRPNPIHYMLSHLREPARMRVVLTTNFDTMIEDAFQQHHRRLDVVPVSIRGSLPHPDLVHSRDTLVKLHGGLIETRADFSLDDEPSLEDRRKFFHYVRGAYPRDTEPSFIPSHLLVAGYSGSDARCVQLLKFVLDSDRAAKIFWLCHSHYEVEHIFALFPESSYRGRLLITVAARFDLLLLELYQRICLHLPPGGDNFPLNHEVPPVSVDVPPENPDARAMIVETIKARKEAKPFVVDGPSGILPVMRDAADALVEKEGVSAVWLELEDCASTAAVAHHLFQAIANKRGLFQLSHALLCPKRFMQADTTVEDWQQHIEALSEHMGITPSQWLVALYGRNGPGGCAGWRDGEFWKTDEYTQLDKLLLALSRSQFIVLYAPYSPIRQAKDRERKATLIKLLRQRLPKTVDAKQIEARVENEFKVPPHPHVVGDVQLIQLGTLAPSREEATFHNVMNALLCDDILMKDDDADARTRLDFLYGLALFRQSRPYSALLAEGILGCPSRFNTTARDNDFQRFTDLEHRLRRHLHMPRVFLRKSGGFLWLYRDIRQGIRALVSAVELAKPKSDERSTVWPREETVSRAHFHIGEWYERAFLVSGHAGTLTEAAFHFYRSAVTAKNYTASADKHGLEDRGAHRWLVAVCQLLRVLRVGRASVRFWMEHAHRLDWFGVDSAREICTALVEAADENKPSGALRGSWQTVSQRLVEMLRQELALLGGTQQPAARILSPLTLYGPELANHTIADQFFPSVISALGVLTEDWWDDPQVKAASEIVSVDLLRKLRSNEKLETKHVFRIWRQQWFAEYLREPVRASHWMQELIETAYISLRRATLDERMLALSAEVDTPVRLALRRELGARWVSVCTLASAAFEVAGWNLPGHDEFVMRTRSKAETIYGLALAHLHRFYEAHRRLNHAHALALRGGGAGLDVMLGIIELRRAEAYLIEAEVYTELQTPSSDPESESEAVQEERTRLRAQLDVREDSNARRGALRDDAWCAAERAEGLLAGRTHGSGWWVRLRTLQLWALSLDAKDPSTRGLTERVRQNKAAVIDRLFSEGRAAFPDDWHNRLRLVDYYMHAAAALDRIGDVRQKLEATLDPTDKRAADPIDARADDYLARLRRRLNEFETTP